MEKRRFIKKLERNIGIQKIKSQIKAINMTLGFFIVAAAFAIYMNHSGMLLSYGIIVAGVAMIALALFLSYRIKLQVKLDNIKMDYRNYIVKPFAESYFIAGDFSKNGGLTEREIIATNMFSDTRSYKYATCNELKGTHKDVSFISTDVDEDCEENDIHVHGRFLEIRKKTPNVNPIVFTSATAPILECQNQRVHLINSHNDVINRMFRVYAFDEEEANSFLTENMIYKLRQIVGLQLGKIIRMSFYSDKIYIYFTTDSHSFEEVLTKKHDVGEELFKIEEKFNVIGKIIDIL